MFLFWRETQRSKFGLQMRVGVAAAVVELDHFFQGGQAAVVHVGRGAGDLAQGRRIEGAAILLFAGDGKPPRVE